MYSKTSHRWQIFELEPNTKYNCGGGSKRICLCSRCWVSSHQSEWCSQWWDQLLFWSHRWLSTGQHFFLTFAHVPFIWSEHLLLRYKTKKAYLIPLCAEALDKIYSKDSSRMVICRLQIMCLSTLLMWPQYTNFISLTLYFQRDKIIHQPKAKLKTIKESGYGVVLWSNLILKAYL